MLFKMILKVSTEKGRQTLQSLMLQSLMLQSLMLLVLQCFSNARCKPEHAGRSKIEPMQKLAKMLLKHESLMLRLFRKICG